ncbi:hypothetical protein ACFX13_038978 [Malus domestica]
MNTYKHLHSPPHGVETTSAADFSLFIALSVSMYRLQIDELWKIEMHIMTYTCVELRVSSGSSPLRALSLSLPSFPPTPVVSTRFKFLQTKTAEPFPSRFSVPWFCGFGG